MRGRFIYVTTHYFDDGYQEVWYDTWCEELVRENYYYDDFYY